jgi:hypothetical protein
MMPLITSLLGGDDGLDEYLRLSDHERQNNLCIYTGKGFIKIPLSHELRVFHKMGDEIFLAAFGYKDTSDTIKDILLGFSDLIPANPAGAVSGSWAELMPDAVKPFFQLKANRNFTGSRIVNEWADPSKPGYLRIRTNKKGEAYAPAFLVQLAKGLDNLTGGDGVEKGWISFNPDKINHVSRGYFGGLYTIGMQVLDLASKTYEWSKTGELKLKVRETPLRTFYASSDDLRLLSNSAESKYFDIVDETKETERKRKGYAEQVSEGKIDLRTFSEKMKKMSDAMERRDRVQFLIKEIKKYESEMDEQTAEMQKEAEKIVSDMKRDVIEIYGRGK